MSPELLAGKRIVVTGVVTRSSIAFSVAERAQQLGAEIVLTSFGRARRLTERVAAQLPDPVDVLELDATRPEDFERLRHELAERLGRRRRRAARDRLRAAGRARRRIRNAASADDHGRVTRRARLRRDRRLAGL